MGDLSVRPGGAREVGAVLTARISRHHEDGLTELDAGGLALFLPRVEVACGTVLRIRIAAHDVILSRTRPEGLSALNMLPGTVAAIRSGDGPGALVALDTAAGRILARITRRSVAAMGLGVGDPAHAIVKTVSVAATDIGVSGG